MENEETNKVSLDYFYGIQSEMFAFLRIPKILIKDGRFEHLSNEAKMLFGLLLDRMSLSMKNGWFDEEDRVYIIYSTDEIMIDLSIGTQKCSKLLKELEVYGLIERRKQGFSQADIIYVKNFASLANDGNEQVKEAELKIKKWKDNKKQKRNRDNEEKIEEKIEENLEKSTVLRKSKDESFENQKTSALKIKGRELRKSKDECFENQRTRTLKIKERELRNSKPNNTDINNTDKSNTDRNNTLTHSLTHKDSQGEEGETEREDVYSLLRTDTKLQGVIIKHTKDLQRYREGLLPDIPRNDIDVVFDHGEIQKKLTYGLFVDSKNKYGWDQVETTDMARRVLIARLDIGILKESKNLNYCEDILIDTLVDYMASIIGLNDSLKINGTSYTSAYLGQKFFELDCELLMHVVETLRDLDTEVKNKKNYYISCLLNAKDHYAMQTYEEIKMI